MRGDVVDEEAGLHAWSSCFYSPEILGEILGEKKIYNDVKTHWASAHSFITSQTKKFSYFLVVFFLSERKNKWIPSAEGGNRFPQKDARPRTCPSSLRSHQFTQVSKLGPWWEKFNNKGIQYDVTRVSAHSGSISLLHASKSALWWLKQSSE